MSWLEEHWDEIVALPPVRTPVRVCAVEACARPKQALGLCTPHYTAARQLFDPGYRARYLEQKRRSRRAAETRQSGGPSRGGQSTPTPTLGQP